MKDVHLICVGKIRDNHLEAIESDYLKRLNSPSLKIHEVKSSSENKDQEAIEVIKKIKEIAGTSTPYIILLTEFGKMHDSPKFSHWLYNLIQNKSEKIIFVIGGAEGHGKEIITIANEKISLSTLTFPHKIARVLFVEQFYRAQTIFKSHPYHN